MKLKKYAADTKNLAHFQNAINSTADENGFIADNLARGEVKIDKKANMQTAKYGSNIPKDQYGKYEIKPFPPNFSTFNTYSTPSSETTNSFIGVNNSGETTTNSGRRTATVTGTNPDSTYAHTPTNSSRLPYNTPEEAGGIFSGNRYDKEWIPKVEKAFSNRETAKALVEKLENYTGKYAPNVKSQLSHATTLERKIAIAKRFAEDRQVGPYHYVVNELIDKSSGMTPMTPRPANLIPLTGKPTLTPRAFNIPETPETPPDIPWGLLPRYRPTDQEPLDSKQLMGEMYALSHNQLEPVPYQKHQPELDVHYDISLQDIMNENQADYRGAQRMSGYNPAALAALNAQKYGANQKVLGEQFRLNQAEKDKVYSGNRNILNNAQLTNLQGLDQQYVRQQEALSNTKATTLAALNSIGAKYAQNKLENRTLGTYENLYNYRYNDQMKAQNYNDLAQFNINGGMGTTGLEGLTEEEKAIAIADAKLNRAKKALATTKTKVRNGAIVQSANKL